MKVRLPVPRVAPLLLALLTLTACQPPKRLTLAEARRGYVTQLSRLEKTNEPVVAPPPAQFALVEYDSKVGRLPAYVSKVPNTGKRSPAIIWLTGGFSNSIGEISWAELPAGNDQSASTFWKAGIVTMYPSLRGGNQNPGYIETLYGEVDDVIAAARYLKTLPHIDPDRVYLGGHSTGGTLALLVAETAPAGLFRAVCALGPVEDPAGYGAEALTYDPFKARENKLRAPIHWLHSLATTTFVFEGTGDGNISSLRALDRAKGGAPLTCFALQGGDHFSIIRPLSVFLSRKILASPDGAIVITPAEVASKPE
jgi:dipeptidyl aminopeptidase/acylaminoacyl peptidase